MSSEKESNKNQLINPGSSDKSSAMSIAFVILVATAILFAGYNDKVKEVSDASFGAAKDAVTLAISLIGVMALWLGFMRILEAGGLMQIIARKLKPLMIRLFPDVPEDHPAMGAMILNMSANILGLGNAATPFGLKAMVELNKLNPFPGTATNAMCLFLAINTSSITLLPLGIIGVRAAAGSLHPAAVFLPTLIATTCSSFAAVIAALWLGKRDRKYLSQFQESRSAMTKINSESEISSTGSFSHLQLQATTLQRVAGIFILLSFVLILTYHLLTVENLKDFILNQLASVWLMPALMLLIIIFGLVRGVKIYEAITDGATQGFQLAVKLIPYLVAILVGVGMFRASGAMDAVVNLFSPLTGIISMPVETLPIALLRPLSGTGAFALVSSLIQSAPDSYSSFVASIMMGSTETTFYILAVYFGSVGISKIRHALVAGLIADIVGVLVACITARIFWGG